MYILTIRTDKPEAEVGVYKDRQKLVYETWQAHRQLAETIHSKIIGLLQAADINLHQIEGIAAFKGPGSFTGLRIGASVANALAYSLEVPIVSSGEDDWLDDAIDRLLAEHDETLVIPLYGSAPNITTPKH